MQNQELGMLIKDFFDGSIPFSLINDGLQDLYIPMIEKVPLYCISFHDSLYFSYIKYSNDLKRYLLLPDRKVEIQWFDCQLFRSMYLDSMRLLYNCELSEYYFIWGFTEVEFNDNLDLTCKSITRII